MHVLGSSLEILVEKPLVFPASCYEIFFTSYLKSTYIFQGFVMDIVPTSAFKWYM